jgi:hypothetical protein
VTEEATGIAAEDNYKEGWTGLGRVGLTDGRVDPDRFESGGDP